jgi:dTDP-4-dehydrorhamnose 3,5-epimerase
VRVIVTGAGGQVGRALTALLPAATAPARTELDLADVSAADVDWAGHDVLVNAAAWTDVDGAQTAQGRLGAWRANATGPAALAALARRHGLVLVHYSSEYVFDGTKAGPYTEDDPVAPLSVYGAAKAAGDLAVAGVERHYLLRPTWVVGQGANFVTTMLGLARRGIAPRVVADQVGRPTFAADVAAATLALLTRGLPYGTYHVTGTGEPASWADVARAVYAAAGRDDLTVTDVTTEEYFADRPGAAPRPRNSVLDLGRATAAGLPLAPWRDRLAGYVRAAAGGR